MKMYQQLAAALVLSTALAFGIAGCQGDAKVVNVSEIGNKPEAFTGEMTVAGIMGGVSQYDKTVIGIMDVKEMECKSGNCQKLFIPVKVAGELPSVGDEVRATGQFRKYPNGFLFEAKKIKVVKKHNIKRQDVTG